MEQVLLEFGLRDGVFAGLFILLLLYVLRTSNHREERLYNFLDSMKSQFENLVKSYESLSKDVSHIRNELDNKMDKHDGR